jgi:capsular exopolysaccharide synthesis family protein
MPTPVTESSEGGQHIEWSETFHAFLFRARIYLKRFWWIIIFTVAAGVSVQKWRMRDAQPSYVSDAEMNVSNLVSINTGTSITEMVANFFQNQIHLMKSADLKNKAIANVCMQYPQYSTNTPMVNPDAEVLLGTSILHLTVTGSDPKFTQYFLDYWMAAYLDKRYAIRDQIYEDYNNNLKKVAMDYDSQIKDLEQQQADYVNSHSFATVDAAEKAANETQDRLSVVKLELGVMNSQLQFLQPSDDDKIRLDDKIKLLGEDKIQLLDEDKFNNYVAGNKGAGDRVDEIDRELASLKLLTPDPEYQADKDQLRDLQINYDDLGHGLGPRHPKMVNLANGIAQLQTKLHVFRLQRVAELEENKNYLKIQWDTDNEERKALEQANSDDLKVVTAIQAFNTNISTLQVTHNFAVQSSTALTENHEISGEILQINLHATEAYEQMPSLLRPVFEGAFAGLTAGVIIIFLLGALDGRIMSIEDLTQRFDEPMLGVIPMQKRVNGQVELLKHGDQRQMFAESCRNIRSSLLYMDRQGQRPRIIMLTSSMPSEGKSTLSSNLAITLGFATSRTLLVDADMRRGQLHKRFNLPNTLGLAEHIMNQDVPLDKIIQSTGSENLDFISCGKYPAQPGELLMSDRFRDSIQTLRQRYDFVVFDSPPILLTDDAASFATRADAVIFVVRAGFTRLRQVRTSLESLHRRGVNVYGMVVNFIDHREPSYYSYRYYDYYSYRPERPEPADRSA